MKKKPRTKLERELIFELADMVRQHLRSRDVDDIYEDGSGIYETGWIRVHKTVLVKLVDLGIMECVHDDELGRGYWAKFKKDWEKYV